MTLLLLFVFLVGLVFVATQNEGFSGGGNNCPNMLVQRGAKYYLYNTRQVEVPGVNPIEFDHLEDYTEFLQWQKSQGRSCPVLYLQTSFDAQGNTVLQSRPSVSEPQGGLPFAKPPPIIPPTQFPQPLVEDGQPEPTVLSPNAMDDNWGGPEYTQELIDEGYYKENEVSLYVP
jgi:hypothetical protein